MSESFASMDDRGVPEISAQEEAALADRLTPEREAEIAARANELESQRCECEPVREHHDFRRNAFYQHAADCPVAGGAR